MAIRIQLRRDTAANWTSTNPVLRAGEFGIETDTLKFKIGNGSSTWTQITNYANVTSSGLTTSLNDYILEADLGNPSGPAKLNASGDLLVPENSIILWDDADYTYQTTVSATQPTANRTITLPDATGTVALTANIPSTTDSLSQGSTNKYFSDELAQDAVATALAAGTHTNITVSYNDASNAISLAAAPGYVDEQAVDAVAAALAAGTHTNISVSYNDAGNAISLTGAVTYTDENAQDAIGNAVGTGLSYNDTTGAISVDTTAIQAKVANVDDTEIGYLNGVTSGIQTQLDTKLASSTAATTYAPIASPTFTGTVSAADLTLSGNLTVNGTTTNLNTTNLVIEDKNIVLGDTATPTDASADGGGITLKGATDKTLNWVDSTDAWTSSEHINLASGKTLKYDGTDLVAAQSGNSGKYLTTDGTSTSWGTVAGYSAPTLGSTSIASGATVTTVAGLTLTTPAIDTINAASGTSHVALYGNTTSGNIIIGNSQQSGVLRIGHAPARTGQISIGDTTTLTNTISIGNGTTSSGNTKTINIGTNGASGSTTAITVGSAAGTSNITLNGTVTGITNTMVGLGNVENTALSTWAGSSSITTLGTIATGVWSGTAIATTNGGTGLTSYTTGDLLYSSATNTLAKLAAGTDGYILTLASGIPSWAAAPISLPSQSGNSGKYLTTDGTSASWGTLVVPIITGTATITANTATTIDTNALNAFTSAEYMVSLKQGSKVRTSKVVVQTDGTSVDMTEFAITETGGVMSGVVVSAAVSSTNAVLQLTVTDAATTNVTVKFSKVAL